MIRRGSTFLILTKKIGRFDCKLKSGNVCGETEVADELERFR